MIFFSAWSSNIRTIVRNGLECEKFPFHPRTWRKGKKTTKKKEEQQKKQKSHAIKRGTQKDRLQVISVGAADEARFLTIRKVFFRPGTTSALFARSVMEHP
jgi:hypothetical protein